MILNNLQQKIEAGQSILGIIGLGYVGLPVACIFAQANFKVIGVDVKANRITKINQGQSPIEGDEPGLDSLLREVVQAGNLRATADYSALSQADVVLIAVDTPVDQNHIPQYHALRAACNSLGTVLQKGTMVIIESTVAPGTIDSEVTTILEEQSGLKAHQDFYLGSCPERVMPGKLLANLRKMNRVCGGGTPETAETMVTLYRHIVEADLDCANIVTAELVKTAENAYRDVQIAFANEVAMICEVAGADVWQVRDLVNKSDNRQMHLPGPGVGGHCIPKDPWLLAYAGKDKVPLHLIPAARFINDHMPNHTANLVINALSSANVVVSQARVCILGYAYLENSDDTRYSPSAVLVAQLHQQVSHVLIHDPWVTGYQGNLVERLTNCDAVVVMVKHREYFDLDLGKLKQTMRTPVLIDGRGMFNPSQVEDAGFTYWGIGRGKKV